ncbi:MAG: DUF2797 domain-containing protein [Bacteroidales bacterium]|nr:DUF2797 domain-containing protein [Bacteroidales bacterium]
MKYEGNIKKMRLVYASPIKYLLSIGEQELNMNSILNKQLQIKYQHKINCINCGAETNKSFHQGYCYSCFMSVPQCDVGVLRPELDMSHKGISRDMEWAKKNSLVDHYVYIAITSGIKVGVTRHTQIPTRWIDQGAIKAIRFAKTPHRNLAGQIEVDLKQYVSDKTNWSKMLKSKQTDLSLAKIKSELAEKLSPNFKTYLSFNNNIETFSYPFEYQIDTFNTVGFDNTDIITGKLIGIKGQYLIFENGDVFNIRKHNGYLVSIEIQ